MFGIVSTISTIEKVIKDNPQWRKIIEDVDSLFLLRDKDIESPILALLSQAGKISFDESISNFPSRNTIEKFCGCAFIFSNLSKEEADLIQMRYGIICQSTSSLDASIITQIDPDHFELLNNEGYYGWRRICEGLTKPRIPSNCLIINDRNIFANDYPTQDRTPGLDNLENLLDVLLPQSYADGVNNDDTIPFQVLINCDWGTLHRPPMDLKESYNTFANRINKIKRKLGRQYPITIEFIALKRDNDFFSETHNRRIYSNYYTISCDHKVAAFKGGHSRCSQSIDVLKLFSKLEKEKSDQPVKGHNSFMNNMTESVKRWMDISKINSYAFSQNGDTRPVIHKISNRLIKPRD